MRFWSRRSVLASAVLVGLLPSSTLFAAGQPDTINIDWATYNPVSMLLKDHGWLEKEFEKDGIKIRWVQTLGSNKALEFLNAGAIDFGSTAGSAALLGKINGNPIKAIYVYSKPEWTALVTRKDTNIKTVADLKGKRVAVTRGTDPHIFLVRALQKAGMTEKDIQPVLLQHPDGATALIRGDVDAWAGLDPMMAQAEIRDGARLFYRDADANTYGILNVREEFAKDHPDLVKRVLTVYETARKYALAHPDEHGIMSDDMDVAALECCRLVWLITVSVVNGELRVEHRVEPVDGAGMQCLALAGRLCHRIDGHPVVDPA